MNPVQDFMSKIWLTLPLGLEGPANVVEGYLVVVCSTGRLFSTTYVGIHSRSSVLE